MSERFESNGAETVTTTEDSEIMSGIGVVNTAEHPQYRTAADVPEYRLPGQALAGMVSAADSILPASLETTRGALEEAVEEEAQNEDDDKNEPRADDARRRR